MATSPRLLAAKVTDKAKKDLEYIRKIIHWEEANPEDGRVVYLGAAESLREFRALREDGQLILFNKGQCWDRAWWDAEKLRLYLQIPPHAPRCMTDDLRETYFVDFNRYDIETERDDPGLLNIGRLHYDPTGVEPHYHWFEHGMIPRPLHESGFARDQKQ